MSTPLDAIRDRVKREFPRLQPTVETFADEGYAQLTFPASSAADHFFSVSLEDDLEESAIEAQLVADPEEYLWSYVFLRSDYDSTDAMLEHVQELLLQLLGHDTLIRMRKKFLGGWAITCEFPDSSEPPIAPNVQTGGPPDPRGSEHTFTARAHSR